MTVGDLTVANAVVTFRLSLLSFLFPVLLFPPLSLPLSANVLSPFDSASSIGFSSMVDGRF